jgi:hypothetical protein
MSFFRTVTVSAADAGMSPRILTQLRGREIDGVIVKQVYDDETCAAVCAELEEGRHGLIRTDFPAKFAAFFYGVNLNLTHPDLNDYFAEAPRFRAGLSQLHSGRLDLEGRISRLLSSLDGGREYDAPPGPKPGSRYMFTTIRAHLSGGYIPAHFDDEQASRPSYRMLLPLIQLKLFSLCSAFHRPKREARSKSSISIPSSRVSRSQPAIATPRSPISMASRKCRSGWIRAT